MSDESKKARRDQARDHARELREAERKRKVRNGWFVRGGVVLGAVAVAVVTVLIFTQVQKANVTAEPGPGPLNMISDGILLTADGTGDIVPVTTGAIPLDGEPTPTDLTAHADTVNIVTYIDIFCPVCQAFEQTNSDQINTWVASGAATLEVHPIAILDSKSMGTRYASRASNAVACVANYQPDVFLDVTTALYANQPEEATAGLTNDEIVSIVTRAGATNANIPTCIDTEQFGTWVTAATTRSNSPIPNSDLERVAGTPTVIVNGVFYQGAVNDATAFATFVDQVVQGTYVAPAQ